VTQCILVERYQHLAETCCLRSLSMEAISSSETLKHICQFTTQKTLIFTSTAVRASLITDLPIWNIYWIYKIKIRLPVESAVVYTSPFSAFWWYSDWLRASDRSSSPARGKIFLVSMSSRPVLGPTQPPIQCVPGALPPGIKRPGREVDNSPPSSAEVKNTWIYTSTPPIRLLTGHPL
jgi:hypothetical protein